MQKHSMIRFAALTAIAGATLALQDARAADACAPRWYPYPEECFGDLASQCMDLWPECGEPVAAFCSAYSGGPTSFRLVCEWAT
jgi:hypothetical protein